MNTVFYGMKMLNVDYVELTLSLGIAKRPKNVRTMDVQG